MRILLIEDEVPAARRLAKLLQEQVPDVQILDTLDSVEGAVRRLREPDVPDLIFMDIQIADGLSFDIFQQVTVNAPVIFTTAFDHYAVQAFKVNAIDYLLKPIDPKDLQNALQRVRERAQPLPPQALEQLTSFSLAASRREGVHPPERTDNERVLGTAKVVGVAISHQEAVVDQGGLDMRHGAHEPWIVPWNEAQLGQQQDACVDAESVQIR